jgi:hypothetical protein
MINFSHYKARLLSAFSSATDPNRQALVVKPEQYNAASLASFLEIEAVRHKRRGQVICPCHEGWNSPSTVGASHRRLCSDSLRRINGDLGYVGRKQTATR